MIDCGDQMMQCSAIYSIVDPASWHRAKGLMMID
jgi:hypothetical protein